MKTVWQSKTSGELLSRLQRLSPEAQARWGRMTAPQMICHLTDALRMATGALPVAPRNLPLRYAPIKQLVIYWLPFPKGAPTAEEIIARRAGDWGGELKTLRGELEAFVRRGPEGPFAEHPAFGRLSPRAWGVLVYRHTDHHLRQFGV